MKEVKWRLRTLVAGAGLVLALALALPAGANAADETLEASFSLEARSGESAEQRSEARQLEGNEHRCGHRSADSSVKGDRPADSPTGEITFNPGNVPVCPDSAVGRPPTDLSQPVPNIVDRCPNSVIGNGTAKFALGQINTPGALLDGVMIVFNGGKQSGRPLIKVYSSLLSTSTLPSTPKRPCNPTAA